MQEHWFGKLIKPDELKQCVIDCSGDSLETKRKGLEALYKGGIRDFVEELFSYDESENKESTHE